MPRTIALVLALFVGAAPAWAGNVTVGGGTMNIPAGTTLELKAGAPPVGKVFDRWVGDTDGVADVFAAETTLTMPAGDVSVTATYKEDPDLPPPPPPTYAPPEPGLWLRPTAETDTLGGDADDPCILLHPTDLSQSRIVGTDKVVGVVGLFDLDGNVVNVVDTGGSANNCDNRYRFPYDGGLVDVVAVSLRDQEAFRVYRMDWANDDLVELARIEDSMPSNANGLCLYRSPVDGSFYVFIACKNEDEDNVRQYRLDSNGTTVTATLVRTLTTAKGEGMVADDETRTLFLSEEKVGVWAYGAEPDAGSERVFLPDSDTWSGDTEGLALYHGAGGTGYVIVSAQGWSRYAVYDRAFPFTYRGSFRFKSLYDENGDTLVDAVTGTDGLEVTSAPLNASYPYGILVVHDTKNKGSVGNNFKIIDWRTIADTELALVMDTSYDPR